MKKTAIVLTTSLLLVSVISCTKDSVNQRDKTFVTPPPPPPPPSNEVKIVSSWFTLTLDSINIRSNACLAGSYGFESNEQYDRSQHVELTYIKNPGQRTTEYKRLPAKFSFPQSQDMYLLNPSFDQSGFSLTIVNLSQPDVFPGVAEFVPFRYRYIIISKVLYNRLNIDWDDYYAVAVALNI